MAQERIIQQTKEFLEDAFETAKDRLEKPAATARKQLADLNLDVAARQLADAAGPLWKKTRKQVQQNPGAALCASVVVGLVFGFLLRGRD